MSRNLGAAITEEIQKPLVRAVLMYEGEFASGTVRLWSGVGDLEWNGETWMGAGRMGTISPIQETDSVIAAGITVSLSGIPQDLVELALNESRQGKPGVVYLAFLDADEYLIDQPKRMFRGKLDIAEIDDGEDTATITISYESRLIDLERARERRYTAEDLKMDYPDDRGLDLITSLQDKVLKWG